MNDFEWCTDEIWTKTKVVAQLECGSAWGNHHAMIQPDVPFGGVKGSGFGGEFGEAGLTEFTSIQTVHVYSS